MSKYTVQLRWLIESGYNLGLADYPIFNESYRKTLNQKIIDHFYFREIGFETPQLFVNRLNEKMDNIMPYYNQLYEAQELKIEPLNPYFMETTYNSNSNSNARSTAETENTVNGESSSNTTENNSSNDKSLFSDTAQGQVTSGQITNNDYLTNATVNTGSENNESDTTGTSKTTSTGSTTGSNEAEVTQNSTERKQGNIGNKSQSELLLEYRRTFINIDNMIMDELNVLFMGVW